MGKAMRCLYEKQKSVLTPQPIGNDTYKTYDNVLSEKSDLNIHANAYEKACVFLLRDTQALSYALARIFRVS